MINPLGSSTSASVAPVKASGVGKAAPVKAVSSAEVETPVVASPAASMAQEGPPVDAAKVAAIRMAFADGTYRIDPQAIARAMVALDFSDRG